MAFELIDMNPEIKITDLEDRIDVEYEFSDVVRIESFGVLMKDYRIIHFKECHDSFLWPYEREMQGRPYVGSRNPLTTPRYIKFEELAEVIIIKFPSSDTFYAFVEAIRRVGYDTYDLS